MFLIRVLSPGVLTKPQALWLQNVKNMPGTRVPFVSCRCCHQPETLFSTSPGLSGSKFKYCRRPPKEVGSPLFDGPPRRTTWGPWCCVRGPALWFRDALASSSRNITCDTRCSAAPGNNNSCCYCTAVTIECARYRNIQVRRTAEPALR